MRFLASLVVVQLPNSFRKTTPLRHLVFTDSESTPKNTPRPALLPRFSAGLVRPRHLRRGCK